MKTKAALLRQSPGKWTVEDVELDEPGYGEVLVEMAAAGLCHSDDHFAQGDLHAPALPACAGHEGAGIVRELGPGVQGLEAGDHVLTSFIPACGQCRWCATGMQNLCDNGAKILAGSQLDGTFRMHTADGRDVSTPALLGTFAEWQVFDQLSVVKIDKDIPLGPACLVSCGVPTGFGSAAAGNVQRGDVVIVAGVGGVGMNAVQGAHLSGAGHIIAVDPVAVKRQWALDFGATEGFESVSAAMDRVKELTNGQGADVCVLTAGIVHNDLISDGFHAIRKAGTLVVTGVSPDTEEALIPGVNANNLAMFQKHIRGVLYGARSPREAMPMLLGLYRAGKLKLDELITRTYTLDEIDVGYADMRNGHNIRGIIDFGKLP